MTSSASSSSRRLSAALIISLLAGGCTSRHPHQAATGPTLETHILFTGIVSIKHESGERISHVEMPQILGHAPAELTHEAIPDHEAFVVVDTDAVNIIRASAPPPMYPQGARTAHLALFLLKVASQLSVKDLSGSGVDFIEIQNSSCQHISGNLYYVPHIGKLINRPECDQNPPAAAAFELPEGGLKAWVLNPYLQDFVGKKGRVGSQRVAQVVDWTFARKSTELTLSDQNGPFLVVEPKTTSVPLAIVVGSASLDDIVNVLNGHPAMPSSYDSHFDVYYDRFTQPSHRPIPFDDTSNRCGADQEPEGFKDWWPTWIPTGHRLVGGFNCGPDQYP